MNDPPVGSGTLGARSCAESWPKRCCNGYPNHFSDMGGPSQVVYSGCVGHGPYGGYCGTTVPAINATARFAPSSQPLPRSVDGGCAEKIFGPITVLAQRAFSGWGCMSATRRPKIVPCPRNGPPMCSRSFRRVCFRELSFQEGGAARVAVEVSATAMRAGIGHNDFRHNLRRRGRVVIHFGRSSIWLCEPCSTPCRIAVG